MQTDQRLKNLNELLRSVTDEDGMLLSEFDGFCTGLLVCPEMIPPSEWLPEIWGSSGMPEFDSEQALQNALDLIMGHYNEVAESLIPPEFEYGPVFEHDSLTEETVWQEWVSGFERAMRLRADAWERIVESGDEEAAASVNMILALQGISEDYSDLSESKIAELREKAPDLITDLVIALNRWTKDSKSADLGSWEFDQFSSSAPYRSTKVGRNDPCPCGSGRKYKRCCGAT